MEKTTLDRRLMYFLLEGFRNSTEYKQIPKIGKMERLVFRGITIVDGDEMKKTHYRFQQDITGFMGFALAQRRITRFRMWWSVNCSILQLAV